MIPKEWCVIPIGDLAKFKSGGTPSKQNMDYWGEGHPWISGKDLKIHYLSESIDELSAEGFIIAKKAPKGASLILVRGMTLLKDFPVGYTTREVAFNQDLKALEPLKNVDGLFLSFLLVGNKHKIKNLVTTAGHGTGRLDTDTLKEFPVILPPLPEQRKIAKILTTWDKAITTTEKLISTSKQQKNSLMQQLLTGKERLLNPETGKPFVGAWEEVSLGELELDISDGNYSAKYPKQSEFLDTGVPFLRANNLKQGTISDVDMRFISPQKHRELTKGHLKKGDILLSTRGELGNVSLVPKCHVGSNINAQLVRINTNQKVRGRFLFQLLNFVRTKGKFEALSTGTALKQLPIGNLKKLKFRLPQCNDEQNKIAQVLTTADKEIEILDAKLAHLQSEKKALMQQLLTGKRRVKIEEVGVTTPHEQVLEV